MSLYVILCCPEDRLVKRYTSLNVARAHAEVIDAATSHCDGHQVYELVDPDADPVAEHTFTVPALAEHDRRVKAEALRSFAKELDAARVALDYEDNRPAGIEYAAALADSHAFRIEEGGDG